jgi:phenylacetate-CoA ligase
VARHAVTHSPFYRDRFSAAGVDVDQGLTWQSFTSLPVLTRTELLTQADSIHAAVVPPHHGEPHLVQTSGSTGQVVAVRRTHLAQLMLYALGMRGHTWFHRDFAQSLAVVRADSPVMDDDARARSLGWGHPASLLYPTGPGYSLPISTPVSEQARWLGRRNPGYLLTYPTNLAALLDDFEVRGRLLPALREVRTVGETVSSALRARCRAILGVPVVDGYSSQEVGVIALECPESGLYHLQSESLIVEVLDASGEPCAPGSVGRVVVTDLHNFATPLLRYDLGDRAEVGPACSCGRGLPTFTRVLGRERNLLALPNGDRHWPLVGLHRYRELGILQYQLVQHSVERIEVRLVVSGGAMGAPGEARLTEIVHGALGHPFFLEFRYFEREIPRSPSGKYEEFICLI